MEQSDLRSDAMEHIDLRFDSEQIEVQGILATVKYVVMSIPGDILADITFKDIKDKVSECGIQLLIDGCNRCTKHLKVTLS